MSREDQERRSIALKAGVWYLISNIMVKGITVITTPVFTRLLTKEEYGIVQTFNSWQVVLLPIFSLNLTYSVGRAKQDFPDRLDGYLDSIQLLALCFSLFLSGAVLILPPLQRLIGLSRLSLLLLLANLIFTSAISFHQNSYRFRYQYKQNIAIAWYLAAGTTLFSLFLVIAVPGNRAVLRIVGVVVPTVALSVFLWGKSLRRGGVKYNREYWRYGLRLSGPLIIHTLSIHVLAQSDRIFITNICGSGDTGIYSLAYTYGSMMHLVTSAASESWLPYFHDTYFSRKYDEIRKNVKPLIILGLYLGLACIALAPEAVLILGGRAYTESVPCVPPVALGVVCQYIYTHYVNIEMHLKKTGYVSAGTICAAALNVVLNAVFIPRFGFVAAAYTTLASYLVLMILHFGITRWILHIRLYDDAFMFGIMGVSALISIILVWSYTHTLLRFGFVAAGFASFLFYFRGFITGYIQKFRHR